MKTAVSIPDDLYESAERLSQERGIPRSQLYAIALRYYIELQQGDSIRKTLNAYYAGEDSRLHPTLRKAQAKALRKDPGEEW